MKGVKIESDYTDFYDDYGSNNSNIVYKRASNNGLQRGTLLKKLRDLSINTIEIKPVTSFNRWDNKLVVYVDPLAHHGDGKYILSVDEAKSMYPNYIASKYIESDNFITFKYLQIGKRRYKLTYKGVENSLDKGDLINIEESSNEFNYDIRLPIFSIDYIIVNNVLVATDFNTTENLEALNFRNYISAENVINEIEKAIMEYNKV